MGYIQTDSLGNITKYSNIPFDDSISLNNEELCGLIEANISDYKFINDNIIYLPRTSPYHAWGGNAWVHSPALVEAAKVEMWEKIKQKRESHKYKGVKINVDGQEHWVHSDESSRIQHLGLLGASILHVFRAFFNLQSFPLFPENLMWKTMSSNNLGEPIFVQLTWSTPLFIFAADSALEGACYARAEYHRIALLASNDPYNYDYTTGWPEVFEG